MTPRYAGLKIARMDEDQLNGATETEEPGTTSVPEQMLRRVVEGLLFASPKPLSAREIRAALQGAREDAAEDQVEAAENLAKCTEADISRAVQALDEEYRAQERSYIIKDTASGWHLVTTPAYGLWVRQLFPELKPTRLTGPALETLAIIAYRQPLTRADMEAIRGVSVDGALQTLLDRGLVKIAGRAETPGRPLLYETTIHFLEHFGLRSLTELPNAGELGRVITQAAETGRQSASKGSRQQEKPAIAEVPAINAQEPPAPPQPAEASPDI